LGAAAGKAKACHWHEGSKECFGVDEATKQIFCKREWPRPASRKPRRWRMEDHRPNFAEHECLLLSQKKALVETEHLPNAFANHEPHMAAKKPQECAKGSTGKARVETQGASKV